MFASVESYYALYVRRVSPKRGLVDEYVCILAHVTDDGVRAVSRLHANLM
jgi:hypothetical protein